MAPAIQAAHDTNTAALEYDAGGISVPAIAERITEMAEANNLDSVSLHGYSIGGMISLETAVLLRDKYGIQVDRIILDQSPSDADTIKSTVRDPASTVFVDIMGTAKSLGFDLEYSEESIKKLGADPFTAPALIYVTSDNPARDYMVDLVAAEAMYRELASRYGLPFMTITVDGVIHSRPDLTLDAYETAFAAASDDIEALNLLIALPQQLILTPRLMK